MDSMIVKWNGIVGMKGPDKDIGLWAAPKDIKEPEDR